METVVYEAQYGRILYNAEDGDYLIFWRGQFAGARASLRSAQNELRTLEYEARRRSPWMFDEKSEQSK